MYLFKPYRSIVRLSAFEDTYRIAETVLVSFAVLTVGETVVKIASGEPYFGYWNILTVCFVVFALLVAMRIAIKYLYTNIVVAEEAHARGFSRFGNQLVCLGHSA